MTRATPLSRNRLDRLALTMAILAAACGGGKDAGPPPPPPPPPPVLTTVTVSLSAATISVGQTATASASGLDQNGAAISVGAVVWSSGAPAVASVSAGGVVSALAPGQAQIVATAGSKQGQLSLTVTPVPVATVVVAPATTTLAIGATQQLTASTLDAGGAALTGRVVAWTSGDSTKVKVNSTGLATAIATGAATITATSEGKAGTAQVTVGTASTAVTIAAIVPGTLTPGGTATITGSGFGGTPAQNAVTIDGVAAAVTTASATQLVVTVPTTIPCSPLHPATVRVTSAGASGTATQPLRMGTLRSMTVGTTVVITNPSELACTELPAGNSRYVMAVVNVAQAPTTVTPFRLQGSNGAPGAASLGAGAALPALAATGPAAARTRTKLSLDGAEVPAGGTSMHDRVLETNRMMYPAVREAFNARRRRLAAAVGSGRSAAASASLAAAAVPAVGSKRTFRVNQFSTVLGASTTCKSFVEITARVAYVGSKSIIWEDTAAPLANMMDSYFTQLGQEFDATMYASDATNFGDPLVTNPYTSNNQHVEMVFTPATPKGLAGFVISCDLFARDTLNNPSSNLGEIFYAFVPTAMGTGFAANTADSWLRSIRSTVVHEVKHIASFGAHILNGAAAFEESWLEEGMARHAEEIWLRNSVYRVPWKGNTTYASSLTCDVRPAVPRCTGTPFGMFRHFQTLYDYLDTQGKFSLFGRVADGDFNFYSSSWSLLRWAVDRYAATEPAFFTAITQSVGARGIANIAAQTGRPVDEMLGNWSLSFLLAGDAAFAGNRDVQFPTWNTRDIYAGMSADFATSFPKTFPLVPQVIAPSTFGIDNMGIRSGSFAMFDLSGNAPTGQTIGVAGFGAAGPASSSLRIALARLQ